MSHEWMDKALCNPLHGFNPDMWCIDDVAIKGIAIHICLEHCPVLAECGMKMAPGNGTVVAGVAYGVGMHPKALRYQPKPAMLCRICLRSILDIPREGGVDSRVS